MNIIVAVDKNWGIGNRGDRLVSIPKDQKMFRQETEGKVVVYGRKTVETFPQKQPLLNRKNIILSQDHNYQIKGASVVHSIEELLEELKKYPSQAVYIIGGESIYKQMLPYCDTAHITQIDHEYQADAFFPNLDEDPNWEMTAEGEEETYFDLEYRFVRYNRKK